MPSLYRTLLNVKTRSEGFLVSQLWLWFQHCFVCVSLMWFWSCVSGLCPHLINDTLVFQQGLSLMIAFLDYICESIYYMRVRWHSPVLTKSYILWGHSSAQNKGFLDGQSGLEYENCTVAGSANKLPTGTLGTFCVPLKRLQNLIIISNIFFFYVHHTVHWPRGHSQLFDFFRPPGWSFVFWFTFLWPRPCACHLSFVKEP